jgi:hypothetical protein
MFLLRIAPYRRKVPRLSAKAHAPLPPSPSVVDCSKLLCNTVRDSATGLVGHQRTSITTLDSWGPGAWTTPGKLFTPTLPAIDKYKPEYYWLDTSSCGRADFVSICFRTTAARKLLFVRIFSFHVKNYHPFTNLCKKRHYRKSLGQTKFGIFMPVFLPIALSCRIPLVAGYRIVDITILSFSSVAYVWYLEQKLLGPFEKKIRFFLNLNFFGSEKFQIWIKSVQ